MKFTTNTMLVPVDGDEKRRCKGSSLIGFCFGLEVFCVVSDGKKRKMSPSQISVFSAAQDVLTLYVRHVCSE